MADHTPTPHDAPHAPHGPGEHAHPGAKEYVAIAFVLLVITVIEVAVFYVPAMKPMLVPTLLILSAVKFGMVVLWYMHLKFDHRLFSWLFVVGVILATLMILALMTLFGVLKLRPS
jgi:cytochrome c oxidase subunit 4